MTEDPKKPAFSSDDDHWIGDHASIPGIPSFDDDFIEMEAIDITAEANKPDKPEKPAQNEGSGISLPAVPGTFTDASSLDEALQIYNQSAEDAGYNFDTEAFYEEEARKFENEQTGTGLTVASGAGASGSGGYSVFKKDMRGATGQMTSGGQDVAPQSGGGVGGKPRIGERLVSLGAITEAQLQVALAEKKVSGKLLGETLVDLGFIDEEGLSLFLANDAGFDIFDPKHTIFDDQAVNLFTKTEAKELRMLPVAFASEQEIIVAMTDPYDVMGMDRLRRKLPKDVEIKVVITTTSVINDAIDLAYGFKSDISEILKELDGDASDTDLSTLTEKEEYSHPIVRLVNALLSSAVKMGVSDLHFEPEENFVRLRNRLDGVLFTAQVIHKRHWNGIAQRLKILSEMNIADKLSPQDGRFGMNVGGRYADFRVSVLPTVHGENIVLRVLDKTASIMPLEGLGFSPENLAKIKQAQSRPEGIIIVTGPTGSGKSTSLYSMLNAVNTVDTNIQTLEDPVEYSVPMLRQTHVKEGILDFADGIRAMLRQDPDIIFIGEIRDGVTAEMALKAAMTGHQVYTTLHTNDSFGAIPRLLDLGLKPGMIAGAIVAVFAQRLARRLCTRCKEAYQPDIDECEMLKVDHHEPPTIYRAKQGGCDACMGQGYKGRISLAEILLFDEDMDDLLANNATKAELKKVAKTKDFKSLKDDGIYKVLQGVTSLEEISRTVDMSKD